jgi:hypothetical protein
MAHKGKATSDVTYNPDDGPEAYTNPTIYSRLHDYTAMAQEVHGPDYDPSTEPIDTDVLMRVGVLEICPRDNHRDEHISLYP